MNIGLTGSVYSLAIDPTNTQVIYAGTNGGVFKSTNGGSTWSEINNGLTNTDVRSLAIDPTSTQVIYAGTYGGVVFKSTNGGESWESKSLGLANTSVLSLAIDPTSTQTIYAGTWDGGVFKSTNGGSSWSAMNNGLTGTVDSLAIDPTNTQTIYAVRGSSVFKTISIYSISASAGTGGTITPSGTVSVNYGDSKTFTITPSYGYKISNVKVDGKSIGAVSSYTFTNITQNHTIEAVFEKEKKETVIILQIGNKNFTVNGETRTLDSPPIIKNSRTLVPIRAIIEALGGSVLWNSTTKKVTINLGSNTIELWIKKNTAVVNGISTLIDPSNPKVVPEIINSRTMLPLRFIVENLGCTVEWDPKTRTITIVYNL